MNEPNARVVPIHFTEEEWQFLRREAEQNSTTVQNEAREAVRIRLALRHRARKL